MYFRDLRSNFWSSFFDKILEGSQSFYSTKVTLCYSNYRTKKSKTEVNYVLYMSISSITHNFEWKNQEMISFENSQETHKYNQEFPSIHWKRDAELMELEIQHFVEFVWIRGKAEKWKSCSLGVSTRRKESRKRSGRSFSTRFFSYHNLYRCFLLSFEK